MYSRKFPEIPLKLDKSFFLCLTVVNLGNLSGWWVWPWVQIPPFSTFFQLFFSLWMVLSSKLDFNLALETANSNFLENIFCVIETNVHQEWVIHLWLKKVVHLSQPGCPWGSYFQNGRSWCHILSAEVFFLDLRGRLVKPLFQRVKNWFLSRWFMMA